MIATFDGGGGGAFHVSFFVLRLWFVHRRELLIAVANGQPTDAADGRTNAWSVSEIEEVWELNFRVPQGGGMNLSFPLPGKFTFSVFARPFEVFV